MEKNLSAKKVTKIAMLISLTVVLSYLSGYLRVGNIAKISLSFITVCMAGAAFGPFAGGFVGGASDFISWAVNPTGPWLWQLTLVEIFYGFLFGILFSKDKDKLSSFKTTIYVLIRFLTDLFIKTLILISAGFLPSAFRVSLGLRLPSVIVMAVLQLVIFILFKKYFSKLIKVIRS